MTEALNPDWAIRMREISDLLTRPRLHVYCGEVHVPGPCADGQIRPPETRD